MLTHGVLTHPTRVLTHSDRCVNTPCVITPWAVLSHPVLSHVQRLCYHTLRVLTHVWGVLTQCVITHQTRVLTQGVLTHPTRVLSHPLISHAQNLDRAPQKFGRRLHPVSSMFRQRAATRDRYVTDFNLTANYFEQSFETLVFKSQQVRVEN